MRKIVLAASLMATACMACWPVAAQVLPSRQYDAEAAESSYHKALATTKPDVTPAAVATSELIAAEVAMESMQTARVDAATMVRTARTVAASRDTLRRVGGSTTPDAYVTVAPGTRREYMLRAVSASTTRPQPTTGEPYHMVPIETRYPVLLVPTLQSVLVQQGRYGRGAAASFADNAYYGVKASGNLDHYEMDARMTTALDEGVPGASKSLAAWNATVPFSREITEDWGPVWREQERLAREDIRLNPRRQANAYSDLGGGVFSQTVTIAGNGHLVVTIVNAGTTPFIFRPENYVFEPGRKVSPMFAAALRSAPLERSAAARCLDAVLPPVSPFGENDPGTRPARDMPMTDEEWALKMDVLMDAISKIVDKAPGVGTAQKAVIAATGFNPFTHEHSFEEQGKAMQDLAFEGVLGKLKDFMPEWKETLEGYKTIKDRGEDFDTLMNINHPEETVLKGDKAARIQKLKEIRAAHFATELDRVVTETAIRRKHAQWMSATYLARWNDHLTKCGLAAKQ